VPGIFSNYPAPVIRNADCPPRVPDDALRLPPPKFGGTPITNNRNTPSRAGLKPEHRCLVPAAPSLWVSHDVAAIHSEPMLAILTTDEERDVWMRGP
jgi:hypothetical protein